MVGEMGREEQSHFSDLLEEYANVARVKVSMEDSRPGMSINSMVRKKP